MSGTARAWATVAALGAIVAITASWWALALWPVSSEAPVWLLRTREVCFGSKYDALPSAAGWLLLVGQPAGMVALLAIVWGAELRAGLTLAMAGAAGQVATGIALALVLGGLGATAIRVRSASAEPFATGAGDIAAQLTRVNDVAPEVSLTDQSGRAVSLKSFRGRPVIVTFAFAHCETVCPLIVADVLAARRRIDGAPPPVLVVTLDPWRDTPSRLASIATSWGLDPDAHLLSGPLDKVERTLNAWRVPRARNQKTGDISHPSVVYIVDADGRIAYVVTGGAEAISAAVRAL
jgi:cytochrome oxidase Cu insertion factor (SCO1/SenC/PrrC family)